MGSRDRKGKSSRRFFRRLTRARGAGIRPGAATGSTGSGTSAAEVGSASASAETVATMSADASSLEKRGGAAGAGSAWAASGVFGPGARRGGRSELSPSPAGAFTWVGSSEQAGTAGSGTASGGVGDGGLSPEPSGEAAAASSSRALSALPGAGEAKASSCSGASSACSSKVTRSEVGSGIVRVASSDEGTGMGSPTLHSGSSS